IGHSLDAKVIFECANGDQGSILRDLVQADPVRLQDLLIVSQANVTTRSNPGTTSEMSTYDAGLLQCLIKVGKADGAKCQRCWKYDPQVGKDTNHPTVCARCATVLNAGAVA
ncbi:MAG TPA: zinc finger domain-containing protein, partial [Candidatus Binatia bacterium]